MTCNRMDWHLEARKIKDLKEYYKNPRKLTKEQADQLKRSISKFGIIDRPVINPDGTIIGGHQRLRTLKKLGIKEIECWVPAESLEEKDVEELNIRLNKNSGEFDYDILANQFDLDKLVDWGFTLEEFQLEGLVDEEEPAAQSKKEEKSFCCPNCGHKFYESEACQDQKSR